MSDPAGPVGPERRGGLFRRLLATFLISALLSAVVAGIAGYTFAVRFSSEWVAQVVDAVDSNRERFEAVGDDPAALVEITTALGRELDAQVGLYTRRGQKVVGDGPPRLPVQLRERRNELREGNPVVLRRGRFEPPAVLYALSDPETGKIASLVGVLPRPGAQVAVPLVAIAMMIVVLGLGAWAFSRSLVRRLARIEEGADRIAKGELRHRIPLDTPTPRDELDHLAGAFNEMSEKIEALLQGQRTLLANVSHELRTPIARMKVLVEILQERVTVLRERGEASRPVQRLDDGLRDLGLDIGEIEALISDLLTSGRLELRHGASAAVQVRRVELAPLLQRVAAKVDATVSVEGELELDADELLIERLLSNLLANARRACPAGQLSVSARVLGAPAGDPARDLAGARVEIAVEDEGSGVDPAHRETIFEPFTRLDDARSRDRGGVGLGLYLCRQICAWHQGTIEVTDRADGAAGARFVVRLPLRHAAAA